jgi:hypothetical protein
MVVAALAAVALSTAPAVGADPPSNANWFEAEPADEDVAQPDDLEAKPVEPPPPVEEPPVEEPPPEEPPPEEPPPEDPPCKQEPCNEKPPPPEKPEKKPEPPAGKGSGAPLISPPAFVPEPPDPPSAAFGSSPSPPPAVVKRRPAARLRVPMTAPSVPARRALARRTLRVTADERTPRGTGAKADGDSSPALTPVAGTPPLALLKATERLSFPLALTLVVLLFLLFQGRVDRRDPKLAGDVPDSRHDLLSFE